MSKHLEFTVMEDWLYTKSWRTPKFQYLNQTLSTPFEAFVCKIVKTNFCQWALFFSILKLLIFRPRSFQNIGLKYFTKQGFERLRENKIVVSTIGLTFSLWLKSCYNILKRGTPG